ncbi:MAG: valine--tRNA ligase [Eubacteriales bacterium]|nr:valine--tRNA ligase [Eubacteriales bacterium]
MSRIDQIAAHFEPQKREHEIYQAWLDSGAFEAHADSAKPPFCLVMPPPNITGILHIGHAFTMTLQDILPRQRRMAGYETLYLPGTDHASIATEAKIVAKMAEEGISKEDLGREGFLERAWAWREQYGGNIVEQSKKLGVSSDWTKERFTMDEGLSRAVRKFFVQLYNEGLIYRGERLVNWCPGCQTGISDIEVEHKETDGHFWHIRYPLSDGSGYLQIATTRPETMLGDTALAVHPDDERYQAYIGKTAILPLVGREIPIIADSYVEREFGTGVVKITPAHDPNDFEVGQRHQLPMVNIMNKDGSINENGGKYTGLSREEARKVIVKDLAAAGYLVKVEDHVHQVGHCTRCDSVVEPILSLQWFVKMEELAKPAIEAVRKGEITFVPERFDKIYYNWLENIRDWCISRQLWWGHQIPAWYCDECGEITVAEEEPGKCTQCGSSNLHQDPDTLDTWFSSALWPFSTLGWPDQTPELEKFFPTDFLVTGYDIIFFWVARMIFASLKLTGQIPFRRVYLNGLVRDAQGRKMSKSLGNGIDPLKAIEEYGADALRFTLVNGSSAGNDMRFSQDKIEAARNFCNKIWNAFRFAEMNFDDEMDFASVTIEDLAREDRWILHELQKLIQQTNDNIEKFEFGLCLGNIYAFLWDLFCDWYIEMVKPRLRQTGKSRTAAQFVLNYVLAQAMKLLHPFMPFITEEIFGYLIQDEGMLVTASWPQVDPKYNFPEEAAEINLLMEAVRGIRNIRAEKQVAPSKEIAIIVHSERSEVLAIFEENPALLKQLANVGSTSLSSDKDSLPLNAISAGFTSGAVYIPLENLVDIGEEISRLEAELDRLTQEIKRGEKMLANESFTSKAPEAVVQKERDKLQKNRESYAANQERLKQLKEA